MILDLIDVNKIASGRVEFYKRINGELQLIKTSKNLVLPNAKKLLAKMLAKNEAAHITHVRVYNGGTLVGYKAIQTFTYIESNEAKFEITFLGPDFNSPFTKVTIGASDTALMGDFSSVDGLSEAKSGTEEFVIIWFIKFN